MRRNVSMDAFNEKYYKENDDFAIKKFTTYPKDVYFVHSTPSTRWEGKNTYPYNQIIYVMDGEFLLVLGGVPYIVRKHQAVFLPKYKSCFISMSFSKNISFCRIDISTEINDIEWSDFFSIPEDEYVVTIKNHKRMEQCLQSIKRDEDISNITAWHLNRVANLAQILALYMESNNIGVAKSRLWSPIINYMHENMHRGVDINELANIMHVHPHYFINKFKETFDISPIRYYNDLRIKKALSLLADIEMPISDIACAIGIKDPYYFSTFFKKRTGLSATKFRELYLEITTEKNNN